VIISYRHSFIFIHLHKTGGDSITAALKPALSRSDLLIQNDWPPWFQRVLTPGSRTELAALRKHSPAGAVARVVDPEVWAQSFSFAVVRHPISRTASLYRYAVRKLNERRAFRARNAIYLTPPGRWNDPLRWRAVRAVVDTDSFSGFIRHPLFERDASMVSQWYSLTDGRGRMLVDFVGRFERIQEDFNAIQDRIGLPRTVLPRRNVSDPSEQPLDISAEDRAYLSDRFRADFAYFGYDPLDA
jgi:hypothetical protein